MQARPMAAVVSHKGGGPGLPTAMRLLTPRLLQVTAAVKQAADRPELLAKVGGHPCRAGHEAPQPAMLARRAGLQATGWLCREATHSSMG